MTVKKYFTLGFLEEEFHFGMHQDDALWDFTLTVPYHIKNMIT